MMPFKSTNMKYKIVLTLFAIASVTVLVSCKGCGRRGNGHVVTQNRTVQPFTGIELDGAFSVEVSQDGGDESVKVETDDNLQQLITVKNDGNTLVLAMTKKSAINWSTKMKVYVNVKSVDHLTSSMVGKLSSSETLKADSLYLNIKSVGATNLQLDTKFLHADLSAVGNTTLAGTTQEARINNASVGALHAYDLKAQTMMIHNTALGLTEIYADSAFYIRSDAVGKLNYKGPGAVKEMNASGVGNVSHVE